MNSLINIMGYDEYHKENIVKSVRHKQHIANQKRQELNNKLLMKRLIELGY